MNSPVLPCEKCVLPPGFLDRQILETMPESIRPVSRVHPELRAPWLPDSDQSRLVCCDSCKRLILFTWRPRDDYYDVTDIPADEKTALLDRFGLSDQYKGGKKADGAAGSA